MAGKQTRSQQRKAKAKEAGDPFEYLLNCWKRERDPEKKRELAFQLLPYIRPRLKAVDVSATLTSTVEVTIGGDDE
ncbi:hypothetical protein [Qingshengfaniella alkalisoli]|uniref:Uncharacterized protein n=1 Tax=Qingshengfaniella alkalisoli TaxID=2599296 RepID=A0A5B8I8K5_9RHOB|nr:hypothetical protein [Qingshengfaniella alkalisoli]QDY70119.1 hypothetical protein FPZ52_11135 [Qingshengfaniella alkalisoli]